jgi:CDP-glucose 4,6-dehydratase
VEEGEGPLENVDLKAFYAGKRVLLTGHTGFKGAWLAWWLKELGAEVTGFALGPEDLRGNLFVLSGLGGALRHVEGDLRDLQALRRAVDAAAPELVFHLAAQPIVLKSYEDPVGTYASNAMGTVHLLEACRLCDAVKTVVVVTTDKCYENKEWPWPYRENDELGGHDPYSSSKAMAELATAAYRRSFFAPKGVGVATARAGNVIGGGDFAPYRIIPDIVESLGLGKPVPIRNPDAVRPWQHVLDALHGYLLLGRRLHQDPSLAGAYNFSPRDTSPEHNVLAITQRFIRALGRGSYVVDPSTRRGHEANYLSLDPSKAARMLGWNPQFSTDQALDETARWYQGHLAEPAGARARTLAAIRAYGEAAHV